MYSVPGVAQQMMTNQEQSNLANFQLGQNASQAIAQFGDPTAFGGTGKTLAQTLGWNVDPATAALARANTIGPDGSTGNSTIAQWHLATQNALNTAVDRGIPMGAMGSSQLAYNTNQANIASQQDLFNKVSALQNQLTGWNQANQNTQLGLQESMRNTLLNAYNTVLKNPSQYGVTGPTTTAVGGTRGLAPSSTFQAPTQTVAPSAGYGGNVPGGANYGGWSYPQAQVQPPSVGYGGSMPGAANYGGWMYPTSPQRINIPQNVSGTAPYKGRF